MLSISNEKQDANKVFTDMYSDVKAEIITDIKIKSPVESGTLKIKLKIKFNLTPRVEINWIPLSHFRNMFPQFCQGDLLIDKSAWSMSGAVRVIQQWTHQAVQLVCSSGPAYWYLAVSSSILFGRHWGGQHTDKSFHLIMNWIGEGHVP